MTFRFAHPEFKKGKRNSNFKFKKNPGIFLWEKSLNLFNLTFLETRLGLGSDEGCLPPLGTSFPSW